MRLIQNTTGSITFLGTAEGNIRLDPGFNEVDSALWDLAKKSDAVKGLLREKKIRDKGEAAIDKLSPSQAAKVAEQTFSVDRLQTWLAAEKRDLVRVAIELQLEKIEGMAKTGEAPENEEADEDDE
jgi:hypothetical protein